jgi:hypothetical protein
MIEACSDGDIYRSIFFGLRSSTALFGLFTWHRGKKSRWCYGHFKRSFCLIRIVLADEPLHYERFPGSVGNRGRRRRGKILAGLAELEGMQ